LCGEPRQVTVDIDRVLAGDGNFSAEAQVITDEDRSPKSERSRKPLIVAVSQPHDIPVFVLDGERLVIGLVTRVFPGGYLALVADLQEPEIPCSVLGKPVGLAHDLQVCSA